MFESISTFATAYLPQLIFSAIVALAIIAYKTNLRFQFWVTDFLVNNWHIRRLSKDRTNGNNGWLRSEQALCALYKPYIQLLSRKDFENRIEYLSKATDLGRTPTPVAIWLFMIIMVIMEGLGFSYLLGSWMATEASANTLSLMMVAIVLALCGLLVYITHSAGHQYHRTSLLRSCFERFKDLGVGSYSINQKAKLNDLQSIDDDEPDYKQIVNRVAKNGRDQGTYWWVIGAAILIVGIGVGSTMMRIQHMKGEDIRQSAVISQEPSNPFAAALPSAVTEPQQAADAKAKDEVGSAKTIEGYSAFVILGIVFVFTQLIGISTGYNYGFVGKESKHAYRGVGGKSTYEDYLAYFQPWRDLANGRLRDLQQRLEKKSTTKLALTKSFDDYLREARAEADLDKTNPPAQRAPAEPEARVAVKAEPEVPVAKLEPQAQPKVEQPAAPAPVVEAAKPAPDAALSVESVQEEMIRLDDATKEQEYFKTLPVGLRGNAQLRQWLKDRKAARELAADDAGLF